jgi:hypothetical protein
MNRRGFLGASTALALRSRELRCNVAVIGGGVGGVAAALAALRAGLRVVLTEETPWVGGQLTSQGVPPDEHPWIEEFGCTRAYREYRNAVREYYRKRMPLSPAAAARPRLNPGNASVSRLSHEPRVSAAVLESMLAPHLAAGRLVLLLEHAPESATTHRDRITGVTVRDLRTGTSRAIAASLFVDATELGDLLPLTKTEFVTGAESRAATGEPHAPSEPLPGGSQAFTWCFAVEHRAGEDHTIERPAAYGQWREYVPTLTPPWPGRLLSWIYCDPPTLSPKAGFIAPEGGAAARPDGAIDLWTYRRIADRTNFAPGAYAGDITLVNWPQNDCWRGDLVTVEASARRALLESARQLSLSLLYWMQTEAPRPDGGQGYPGLRPRGDVMGTADGLARAPYIRESRRIRAEFTVREQHVGTEARAPLRTAEKFRDSAGVGAYRIDLHPSAAGVNYIDIASLPFQIPLGALIPERVENLLAGAKNVGTTHVTNGCYRLHPVEWNIGEAAGALAARAVRTGHSPRAIRGGARLLADFQASLVAQGFELDWPAWLAEAPGAVGRAAAAASAAFPRLTPGPGLG